MKMRKKYNTLSTSKLEKLGYADNANMFVLG